MNAYFSIFCIFRDSYNGPHTASRAFYEKQAFIPLTFYIFLVK